jgi:RPA family protein
MREFAWRVFAGELNSSDYEFSEGGDRVPTYLVTPLGAKVNRLLAVGVLTELDNLGDEREPMWKARVYDPTGSFFITAGQYQMEAAGALSKLKPPAFVSVIGKCRVYSPEEGVVYVSVRPELIKEVNSYLRDYWILDACKSLKGRLDLVREALELETRTKDKLMALGCREELAEGIVLATDHYDNIELGRYEQMLVDALRYILEEDRNQDETDIAQKGAESAMEGSVEAPDKEEIILELIDNLDTNGKGANWDEIVSLAKKKKIRENELEEAINDMFESGKIFEPVLGKIKKA